LNCARLSLIGQRRVCFVAMNTVLYWFLNNRLTICQIVIGSFWDLGCCDGSVRQVFVVRTTGRKRDKEAVGSGRFAWAFRAPEIGRF